VGGGGWACNESQQFVVELQTRVLASVNSWGKPGKDQGLVRCSSVYFRASSELIYHQLGRSVGRASSGPQAAAFIFSA
jgi:hypothetical protein